MEMYQLMNTALTLKIAGKGAEIRSLVDNATGHEYMWQADPAFWGWTSPVLFPVVGAFRNDTYRYDGKTYHMKQHGFARHSEFVRDVVRGADMGFSLTENENTLAVYPFRFRLEVGYSLKGRSVKVLWRVINPADTPLYFSIGAHPAFNCPPDASLKKSDCYLGFNTTGNLTTSLMNLTEGGLTDKTAEVELAYGTLPIRDGLFDINTLIIEGRQASKISLMTPEKRNYVTVAFDAPLFGIWSPSDEAPFVCLEPWYGRLDRDSFEGSLEEREYIQTLPGGGVFEASYTITVGTV